MRLSQPSTSTGVIGSADHCGNWLSISRRARDTSIRSSLTGPSVRHGAALGVRAIELGGAQVAATAHVGAKGAFRLALVPGAYVLDVSVSS